MGFWEVFKKLRRRTNFLSRPLITPPSLREDTSGIALFMVLSAVSILAILVTEFTYIAQISQSIAYGGLDHAKAHYLAKSGFKLSLLRLKAYQNVNTALNSMGQASQMISPGMLQKIWSFPFFYPIPTNIPGMSTTDMETIKKFQTESGLEGSFSSVIESESGKFNLNVLVSNFNQIVGAPTPSTSPTTEPKNPNQQPTPQATPVFDMLATQKSINQFISGILNKKFLDDPEFGSNYRDFRLNEFIDILTAWAVRVYERSTSPGNDKVRMKQAPLYSLSELRMLPLMDDDLYNLLSPSLTACPTTGININTMTAATFAGILPGLTDIESTEFFKYRDSSSGDNLFKSVDAFYKWLSTKLPRFMNSPSALDAWKKDLSERNIHLVHDETFFKITVQAKVNHSIKTIEAWVMFDNNSTQKKTQLGTAVDNSISDHLLNPNHINPKFLNSGLKITFMRIF